MKNLAKHLYQLAPMKVGVASIICCCLAGYAFGEQKPQIFSTIDAKIVDAMFRFRGPLPTTGEVIIVDIDDKSLNHVGQWPWPRTILVNLVKKIHNGGAKVFGFDFVFPEVDRTSPSTFF